MRNDHLSILYVAYPLLSISDQSAGGAEQVLLTLEADMLRLGHRTAVAAANGSQVSGRLLGTGRPAHRPDQYEERVREHSERIQTYLQDHPREFDIIHDHSGYFWSTGQTSSARLLATLHLPRPFYPEQSFRQCSPEVQFNCVSESQARTFEDLLGPVPVVPNGISVNAFEFSMQKKNYLLWLGRICEEKAPHLAIEVARGAGLPLILAGQVYPFSYHRAYFRREIAPFLQNPEAQVRFVDSPSFEKKVELLRDAKALLLTSSAEETSSLVALEAMASGTPVLAFRRGGVPEVVTDGKTGFLVDSSEEMSSAISRLDAISPTVCRNSVEEGFSSARMALDYENLYERILAQRPQAA